MQAPDLAISLGTATAERGIQSVYARQQQQQQLTVKICTWNRRRCKKKKKKKGLYLLRTAFPLRPRHQTPFPRKTLSLGEAHRHVH